MLKPTENTAVIPDKITSTFFKHVKREAAQDNIKITLHIIDGIPYICFGRARYATRHGVLNHVHAQQQQIDYSAEVRS